MNPEPQDADHTGRSVTVRGATLAGMAAAARLARLGHSVTLITDGEPLGGRWAPGPGPDGQVVDAMAQVITLPATWRDLFKKSGAHLQTELNRVGLALAEAPPAEHRFADGTVVGLPTDRAGRFRAVEAAFGTATAGRWRMLAEGLDDLWSAYRHHALEGVAAVGTRDQRRALWLDRTLGDLADDLRSPLGRILTDLGDSPRSPGVLAVGLHAEHLFGRWQLMDADGAPQRPSRLLELLSGRLRERGVAVVEDSAAEPTLDCRPALPNRSLLRRAPGPAAAPLVRHDLRDGAGGDVREVVDHTAARPVSTWLRPGPGGVLATTHDHNHPTPDPRWGAAAPSARDWLGRVPIRGGTVHASATSPAGSEPWAELSSAALAVYEVHQRLTGQDSRPTNKEFRPPRLT